MKNDTADDLLYPDDYDYRPDDDHYRPESEDIAVAVLLLLGIFPILPALGWIIWSFYRKLWSENRSHSLSCPSSSLTLCS
ncbi:hypothetical protein J4Q44_G00376310 [Coregonus suidteri]|uniref:Uncharacterized protein n=1 Tax=Coregonus suidteri TaxID=861788 RepID=A0AAN8Q9V4_9TELE